MTTPQAFQARSGPVPYRAPAHRVRPGSVSYLAPAHRARPVAGRGWRRPSAGALGLIVAVLTLNLLVVTEAVAFARAAIGFPVVMSVPGFLALTVVGGPPRRGWDRLVHAVTLSLAVLIVLGTVLALLPGPALTATSALVAFDLAVTALGVAAALRRRAGGAPRGTPVVEVGVDTTERAARPIPLATAVGLVVRPLPPGYLPTRRWPRLHLGTTAAVVGLSAAVTAVALAVYGARQLNTGGGAGPSTAALAVGIVAFVAAVVAARGRRTTAAATIVYLLSAAVLLATSLRGAGVTGHDIKIEYRVFRDTLDSGSWLPGGLYPGYNSCLSLTVLPSLLARLLGLAALDVFRVCFQLIFALVPVAVLLIGRRLLRPGYAVLSAGLFIAFPTFVNDLPMLNRQEIALLFLTVGLLALLDTGPRWRQVTLFTIAATGMTVSHYSTAGITAALLLVAWLARVVRRSRNSAQPLWYAVLTMITLVVGWSAVTGSAAAFAADLADTARAVSGKAPVLSDSVGYSPVAGAAPADDATALRTHTDRIAAQRAGDGVRPVEAACTTTVLPADELAPTGLGRATAAVGVAPSNLNTAVRRGFVALFAVGAVAGCPLLWWRHRHRQSTLLVAELGTAGVVLLGVILLVPQVTDSYGLLRIYQQLLSVLGVAVVVFLTAVVRAVAVLARSRGLRGPRSTVIVVVTAIVAACLITTTGLLPRLTGGYAPQLNLANAGPYYRGYLADPDDVALAQWSGDNLPADAWVVADGRDTANLRALTALVPDDGVTPGAIPDDAYLLLTVAGAEAVATAIVGDRIIRYAMATACLTANRSIVHVQGSHVIYAPYGR